MLRRILRSGLTAAIATGLANRLITELPAGQPWSIWQRTNYADRPVTMLGGLTAAAGVLSGLLTGAECSPGECADDQAMALVTLGSALVGSYDDLHGDAQAKGFAGHLRALRSGTITSGLIKITGIGAAAAGAASMRAAAHGERSAARRTLTVIFDTGLIAATANAMNLCDLRPGRAAKAVAILGTALLPFGSAPALGAALGSLPADLAERTMLGDAGANALGAAIGVAGTRAPTAIKLGLFAVVAGLNLASERVSLSEVIAGRPLLRRLDQWGRRLPADPQCDPVATRDDP